MYWESKGKIYAIKTLREITGLGLREAKDIVEANYPTMVKSSLSYLEANAVKQIVERNGLEARIFQGKFNGTE